MKRYLPLLFLLSACSSNLTVAQIPPKQTASSTPAVSGQNSSSQTLFGNAKSKRSLSLDLFAGSGQAQTGGRDVSSENTAGAPGSVLPQRSAPGASVPMASGGGMAMPVAPPTAGRAVADSKMIGMAYGEFNQFVLQFAEENIFDASSAKTLLTAYNQTVKPLLNQWDASGRLIESQARLGTGSDQQDEFYLPGPDGKPQQLKVNYMYRFASTQRKETLVVYLTDSETRVHRMVWGEPNIDLSRVKLDSAGAKDLALKAFNSRSATGEYPVYPDQSWPGMEIIYSVPNNARWQISLNQHSGANRYFVSVMIDQPAASEQEKPVAYGSAEIDADSGKIVSLNRPVYYRPMRPEEAPRPANDPALIGPNVNDTATNPAPKPLL